MIDHGQTSGARAATLKSIRKHLAASAPYEGSYAAEKSERLRATGAEADSAAAVNVWRDLGYGSGEFLSPLEMFAERLIAAGGHCVTAAGEARAAQALTGIIAGLQTTSVRARRIALSNAPLVARLAQAVELETDEIAIAPGATELFNFDVGITTAQAAIAETGTLVLESESERHRLVSLLPPVHIAIVAAANIYPTLGVALARLQRNGPGELSRTITFITGPSRTADIELTLTIGVHGPRELYVIVNDDLV